MALVPVQIGNSTEQGGVCVFGGFFGGLGTGDDKTETPIWSYTIPANATTSAPGKALFRAQIFLKLQEIQNNSKTIRVYIGNSKIYERVIADDTLTGMELQILFGCDENGQGGYIREWYTTESIGAVEAGFVSVTTTEDPTQDIQVLVTGQNGVDTDEDSIDSTNAFSINVGLVEYLNS